MGFVLSYFLVKYSKVVAQCNEKLSEETERLRKIAQMSWYDKEFAGYLSDKYCGRIKDWPKLPFDWYGFDPTEEEKPKVFKMYCRQIIIERLFPEAKSIEGELVIKLKEKGFGFKEEN